jgi:hypothetical protein
MGKIVENIGVSILLAAIVTTSWSQPRRDSLNSPIEFDVQIPPSAIICDTIAEFWFPVDEVDRVWVRNVYPDGGVEYSWEVEVILNHTTYEIGHYYASRYASQYPNNINGTLEDILEEGSSYVARLAWFDEDSAPDGAYGASWQPVLVTDKGVQSQIRGKGVLLTLSNKAWIDSLLKYQPKAVSLISDHPRYREQVQVEYRVSEKSSN